jgi:hypothetical protein
MDKPCSKGSHELKDERPREVRRRSKTIPMPTYHVPRTKSEVQLHEDMAAAEWRDLCMFYRVVNGIRERQLLDSSNNTGDNDGFKICSNESIESMLPTKERNSGQSLLPLNPNIASSDMDHTDPYCYQTEGLQYMLAPQLDARPDIHDGWSISGYEEVDPSYTMVPVIEVDDVDDAVFSMEL